MANQDSGSGLPHYKNSQVSVSNLEPVYLNLLEVIITPPSTVGSTDLLLESITKINGMNTDQTPPAGAEQMFKGVKRRFANALPESTTVDLLIGFNVNVREDNSLVAYKALRQWCELIWNPRSGAMLLKKDYVGGPINVFVHNKVMDVLRQWVFPVVWPISSLPPMELDYADGAAIYSMEMTFAADFWEDMIN